MTNVPGQIDYWDLSCRKHISKRMHSRTLRLSGFWDSVSICHCWLFMDCTFIIKYTPELIVHQLRISVYFKSNSFFPVILASRSFSVALDEISVFIPKLTKVLCQCRLFNGDDLNHNPWASLVNFSMSKNTLIYQPGIPKKAEYSCSYRLPHHNHKPVSEERMLE